MNESRNRKLHEMTSSYHSWCSESHHMKLCLRIVKCIEVFEAMSQMRIELQSFKRFHRKKFASPYPHLSLSFYPCEWTLSQPTDDRWRRCHRCHPFVCWSHRNMRPHSTNRIHSVWRAEVQFMKLTAINYLCLFTVHYVNSPADCFSGVFRAQVLSAPQIPSWFASKKRFTLSPAPLIQLLAVSPSVFLSVLSAYVCRSFPFLSLCFCFYVHFVCLSVC